MAQSGKHQELIGRGRGIDGEVWYTQPPDRGCPPPQSASHEGRRRCLARELVTQGPARRTDPAEGDVRGPEAEQVRTRDHAPGPAPAAWRVRGVKLDADVCQPGQSPEAIARGRVKHSPGGA